MTQPNQNPEPAREAKLFHSLRTANVARQAEWCPEQTPDLSFRGNELAGEVGEVCNVIKKLERERLGWRGSRDNKEHLAEELADVVICADLIGIASGIDLEQAVTDKFNNTSSKVGLPHRLTSPVPAPAREQAEEWKLELLEDYFVIRTGSSPIWFVREEKLRTTLEDTVAAHNTALAAVRAELEEAQKWERTAHEMERWWKEEQRDSNRLRAGNERLQKLS